MDRKKEFQTLYRRLDASAAEVAVITGKSTNTVRQYLSDGAGSRVPTDAVLAAMRGAWREKAKVRLAELVEHLRDEGVGIDWASLEEHGPVERIFRPAPSWARQVA